MNGRRWLAALACLGALPAGAADVARGRVTGKVVIHGVDDKDRPDAKDIVVYLVGFAEEPPASLPELRQKDRQFQPAVLPITVGQRVSFPNRDPIFHNVFSLSAARRFDLGQFREGETKVKEFPKTGVVDVYCNIHPDMAATILVLPNRRFTTAGPDGSFVIPDVPVGTWEIYAYDRFADLPGKGEVIVRDRAETRVELEVRESRTDLTHKNKYGESYGSRPYPR